MRTIERQMLAAIHRHRFGQLHWRCKNTTVNTIDEVNGNNGRVRLAYVYLHNHLIAKVKQDGTVVYASLCGYDTVTTKSRLRALGVDVWKLRRDEGHITQEEYMDHLRRVENERTRRKLASA